MGNAESLGYELVLCLDFIPWLVRRKAHLQPAVARAGRMLEVRLRIPELVTADDEVLVRVERLARADQVIQSMMVRAEAVQKQNRVVLGGTQLSVSDVGHL